MIATLEKAKSWEELQARIYLDNMRRATTAILPQAVLLVIGYGYVSGWILILLGLTAILLHMGRWTMTRPDRLPADVSAEQALQAIRTVNIMSSVHGVWIGLTALILLPSIPPTTALVTAMILFGLQAGSVATTTVHPPTFMNFSLPIFVGFSIGVVLQDHSSGLIVPPLYFLFLLVLFAAVKNAHGVLRSSYELRVERNLALQRAEEANRQKERFLATASHDLRQPAAALAFMSEELSAAQVDPSLVPVVSAIRRSSDNINSLIDTLFDLSKLNRALIDNDPQWISLADLVENQRTIIAGKAEAKGLAFKVNSVPGYLYADPSHIQRWLGNLLDNAVKYTQQGQVALDISLRENVLSIAVSDSGSGIDAADLSNIWDEHFRAERNSAAGSFSLGLGLSIVKRLSELLDVQPKLESTAGKGTRISAEFGPGRYREVAPVDAGTNYRGRLKLSEGKRLLVVEDNPDVAEALQRHLSNLGFAVDVVHDAPEARRKLMHPDDYALLLTDNRLPDNELGVDVCAYANRGSFKLPCLLISADELGPEMIPDKIEVRRLKKPLQTNQLKAEISALLHHAKADDSVGTETTGTHG